MSILFPSPGQPTAIQSIVFYISTSYPDCHCLTIVTWFTQYVKILLHDSFTHLFLSLFPAGYAFLLFREEAAVHRLVKSCLSDDGKFYMFVSSLTQANKKVCSIPDNDYYVVDCYLKA